MKSEINQYDLIITSEYGWNSLPQTDFTTNQKRSDVTRNSHHFSHLVNHFGFALSPSGIPTGQGKRRGHWHLWKPKYFRDIHVLPIVLLLPFSFPSPVREYKEMINDNCTIYPTNFQMLVKCGSMYTSSRLRKQRKNLNILARGWFIVEDCNLHLKQDMRQSTQSSDLKCP